MSPIEKSMFIIKPEAVPFKERIMSMVEDAGIPIIEWRTTKITKKHIEGLYPGISGENLEKTKDYLLGKEVLAVVVETEDAVDKLYKLCGENTKSFLCEKDTIRFSFKNIVPIEEKYNKNIIHRPINKDEAEKHIVLFFPKRD
jgi:nucleoside diphosphate kinase